MAERDGSSFIAAVLDANGNDVYHDVIGMFEYAFHNFKSAKVIHAKTDAENVPVTNGLMNEVGALTEDDVYAVVPIDTTSSAIEIRYDVPESLAAPISQGAIIGTAAAFLGAEELGSTALLASVDVQKEKVKDKFNFPKSFLSVVVKIVIGIVIAIVAFGIFLFVTAEIRKRGRRKRRLYKSTTHEVKRVKRIK
jgi:D-alanyl-D-alanine carboxypeptidase (penicillin-binding protein 5/6)